MIDFKKFANYSKAGPRYTSYPTAVEFRENFGVDDFENALNRNDKFSNLPLSIYVHLPFCKSACYFCACNVIYTNSEEKKERYLGYLKKELELIAKKMDTSRQVVQLHFGGGTPTYFNAKQLEIIVKAIYQTFPNFAKNAEISCEIDPRHFTREQMDVLKAGGFNRVSFGVQDFDGTVQKAINRFQSIELMQEVVKIARDAGIGSINFDLIYGLPYQSTSSFMDTLKKAVSLGADRFAVFNYAHVPWIKRTMGNIDEKTLPTPETKLEILKNTIAFLKDCGYEMIGMDHFAKSNDELTLASKNAELRRNFQGYTTRGFSQTIGIGLTSIGEGLDYYAQNFKDIKQYEAALDSGRLPIERGVALSDEDRLRKEVIMQLMNNAQLEFKKIEALFDIDFKTYFAKELKELQVFVDDGILEIKDSGIYANATGGMLIRNIAMVFDAYLDKIPEDQRRFSKTV